MKLNQLCMAYGRYFPESMAHEFMEVDKKIVELSSRIPFGFYRETEDDFQQIRSDHGDQRVFQALNYSTRELHEWKHFIDFSGTAFGHMAQGQSLRLLTRLLGAIRKSKCSVVFLPLKQWAQLGSCPRLLREWVRDLESTDEFLRVIYGGFEIVEPNHGETGACSRRFAIGTKPVPLPCLPSSRDRLFVLGAATLLEGGAFILQAYEIASLYGDNVGNWFFDEAVKRRSDGMLPYVGLSLLNENLLKRSFLPLDYALADFCLFMGYPESPLFIYIDCMDRLRSLEPRPRDSQPNLFFERFKAEVLDIPSMLGACDRLIPQADEWIHKTEQAPSRDRNLCVQQRNDLETTYKQLLSLRRSDPDVFLDPNEFLVSADIMPKPRVTLTRGSDAGFEPQFELRNKSIINWQWVICIKLMNDIYDCQELVCPFKSLHIKCTLKGENCEALYAFSPKHERCTLWEVLWRLGIDNVTFKSLRNRNVDRSSMKCEIDTVNASPTHGKTGSS